MVYRLHEKEVRGKLDRSKVWKIIRKRTFGASMRLINKNGNLIEHWISGKKPHRLKCQLIPDETYFLVDESAFYGYAVIGQIAFTISKNDSKS